MNREERAELLAEIEGLYQSPIVQRLVQAVESAEEEAERLRDALCACAPDLRWDVGVDWMLNHGTVQMDVGRWFWAFYDGLISEEELRTEQAQHREGESTDLGLDDVIALRAEQINRDGATDA